MPDETKGTNQDTSARDSSEESRGSTSQETPTFTKADMDKAIEKAKSDALAKAGRDAKALELKAAEIAKREEAHAKWQREQDEAEEEAARGDDNKLSEIQRRRKIREEQDKIKADRETLEREKAEHAEALKEAQETKREVFIWNIASKHGLDAAALKADAEELGLDTEEKIEKYASKHSTTGNSKVHVNTRETGGSNTKIGDLPPKERIKEADKQLRK